MATKLLSQLDQVVIILHRPQDVTNIGAIVRAMKNMGVSNLRLVQPIPFENEAILRLAHRCEDILQQMTIHADLDGALADLVYVVGTAAITHHKRPLTQDLRGLATSLVDRTQSGQVGLLFGQEDDGLDNHALDRCHLIAMIPSNPAYPALNLAQSALLFLYELRMASATVTLSTTAELSTTAALSATSSSNRTERGSTAQALPSHSELETLFDLSEQILQAIDFFRYNPAVVMRTLRQIVYRAELAQEEQALLMAILRKLQKAVGART